MEKRARPPRTNLRAMQGRRTSGGNAVGASVLVVGLLVVSLINGACGSNAASGSASDPAESTTTTAPNAEAAAALARWAGFPVADDPRPIVLTQGRIVDPAGGFSTNDQKEAYLEGAFAPPASLPPTPDGADHPLISAQQALDVLQSAGTGSGAAPLSITEVTFGSAPFDTDRGSAVLPAWLVHIAGVEAPAAVLAVDPSAIFEPAPGPDFSTSGASLGSDGTTVVLRIAGAPDTPGPCGADYSAEAFESAGAVAVAITTVQHESPSGPVVCTAIGALRQVTVTLDAPLGARVLIAASGGAPIPVNP